MNNTLTTKCSNTESTELSDNVVNSIKAKQIQKVVVFFVGGAVDKEAWAFFYGPTYLVRDELEQDFKNEFDAPLQQKIATYYLGYEDLFREKNIENYVIKNIPDKENTVVYLVGHSLGGWNSAHLSQILSDKGYNVDMLITLDPVGTGFGVKIIADIYWHTPTPKANYWVNFTAEPVRYAMEDFVADVGGQWRPKKNEADISIIFPGCHRNVGDKAGMFGYPIPDVINKERGKSTIKVQLVQRIKACLA